MAIQFPTSLDVLTNPLSTDPPNNPSHAEQHANANDAIEALEAKVGIDGSEVTSSLDFKVATLETDIAGKADSVHTHTISQVTGLQTALDGKAASSHTHAIADVTGLQTALDGKAATSHTHAISDVTGLQTALDGKSDTSHTHTNITVATTTDANCSVLLSTGTTGSIQPKTDPGIVYNATTNLLSVSGTISATTMLATTFSGNLAGNASSASVADFATVAVRLNTPRAINGVDFDGTAPITVACAAGTLTGDTLASNVLNSSLTSVGTLATLTVTATITGSVSGNAGTATKLATARAINGTDFDGTQAITITAAAGTLTGNTLASGVTISSLTQVGTITVGVWNGTAISAIKGGTEQTTWTTGDLLFASAANTLAKLAIGARTGMSLRVSGGLPVWADDMIVLEHQEAQNTAGGTFTTGADRTATLNTEVLDAGGHCTLSSNQFTLAAGTYRIFAWTQGYVCGAWQSWLYNVTDSDEILRGGASQSTVTSPSVTESRIEGQFTIAAGKALEIRKRCTNTRTTNGYGVAANFGTEVYTRVILFKVG